MWRRRFLSNLWEGDLRDSIIGLLDARCEEGRAGRVLVRLVGDFGSGFDTQLNDMLMISLQVH